MRFRPQPGDAPCTLDGARPPVVPDLVDFVSYDRPMGRFDIDETFNDDYLWFYEPRLTEEHNRDEAAEIVATLGIEPGSSILDAPCGHGRISNLLAADGFVVTGIDVTDLFLQRARTDGANIGVQVDYRHGDLRDLPVSGPFDAAVCWFTSFGYFDDHDNRKVLGEFARVLKPGGRLLIETLHHDGFVRGLASAPVATVTERGDDVMIDITQFDSVTGRVETDRTVRRDGRVRRSHHSVRLPTVPELDAWLAGTGYTERAFTDRAGGTLRFDSWRMVATAVKQ